MKYNHITLIKSRIRPVNDENHHEIIIDKDTWERVHKLCNQRAK